MADHSPTGFAFGTLLEVAVIVVVVSILPRFDLRPPAQAEERLSSPAPSPSASQTSFTSFSGANTTSRPPFNASPVLLPAEPISNLAPPPAAQSPRLAAHEVEQRLDRASQQLVNTLGTAAADWSGEFRHQASRPTLPAQQLIAPPQSLGPPWTGSGTPRVSAPVAEAPHRRRWINY